MLPLQEILSLAVFLQSLVPTLTWVPITSPLSLQNYVIGQMAVMRPPPPPLSAITQQDPQSGDPIVDFRKPQTQTFYRAALSPFREPVYEFRYKVHEPKEDNYQERAETRVGDSVRGYYSVREPNGFVRFVRYVSDENGFQTQVSHHFQEDRGEHFLAQTRFT